MNRTRIAVALACMACAACTVKKTEDGKAPDVDISVDSARLPQYQVQPAKVEIGKDTQTVVTPEVKVTPKTNE